MEDNDKGCLTCNHGLVLQSNECIKPKKIIKDCHQYDFYEETNALLCISCENFKIPNESKTECVSVQNNIIENCLIYSIYNVCLKCNQTTLLYDVESNKCVSLEIEWCD